MDQLSLVSSLHATWFRITPKSPGTWTTTTAPRVGSLKELHFSWFTMERRWPGGWAMVGPNSGPLAMDQAVDPSLKLHYLHSKTVAKQCVGLGPTNIDERNIKSIQRPVRALPSLVKMASFWCWRSFDSFVFWSILTCNIQIYHDISRYLQFLLIIFVFFVILSHPFVARCCKSWLYMNYWLSNDLVRQFWQCQILLFWQLCLFVNYVLTRPFTMHYVTLCINMHYQHFFSYGHHACKAQTATHPFHGFVWK